MQVGFVVEGLTPTDDARAQKQRGRGSKDVSPSKQRVTADLPARDHRGSEGDDTVEIDSLADKSKCANDCDGRVLLGNVDHSLEATRHEEVVGVHDLAIGGLG